MRALRCNSKEILLVILNCGQITTEMLHWTKKDRTRNLPYVYELADLSISPLLVVSIFISRSQNNRLIISYMKTVCPNLYNRRHFMFFQRILLTFTTVSAFSLHVTVIDKELKKYILLLELELFT